MAFQPVTEQSAHAAATTGDAPRLRPEQPDLRRAREYRASQVERVERLAAAMDNMVKIPGTNVTLGLDSVVGLVPGVGDTATLLPSLWIVNKARKLDVPTSTLMSMLANVGIDWVIGSIPLLGDVFDIGFKANSRNARLLREAVEKDAGAA